LREQEERRLAEEQARLKAEEESRRVAEELRADAEVEARRRAEAEEILRAEEARIRAEIEGRQKAEEETRRLAEETRLRAEEEAQQRAEAESRLREEQARLQAEEDARRHAEEEMLRLAEIERQKAERAEETRLESEQEPTQQSSGFEIKSSSTSVKSPETSWENVFERNDSESSIAKEENQQSEPVSEAPAPVVSRQIDVVHQEKGLVAVDDSEGIPSEVIRKLNSEQISERVEGLNDLAQLGGEDAFHHLSRFFDDQSPEVRNAAARALYSLHADCAASFTRALREGSPERRRRIGASLASSGLAADAIANLTGESREKTYDAFSLLFLMAKAGEVQPLMKAIEEYPNTEVRLAVVKLLALSGQAEIVPAFRRLAVRGSLPSEVRSAVMEAIYQISSQSRETTSSAA
jgi:hypothetical protein